VKSRGLFLFLGVVFFLVVLFGAQAVLAADSKIKDEVPQIVKVYVSGRQKVAELANMGLDIAEVKKNYVVLVLSKTDLRDLETRGFKYRVMVDDANSLLAPFRSGTLKKYHSFEQVEKIMKDAEKNYPDICKLEVIGKSFEGRSIYAMNISGNVTGKTAAAKKPACLFMGLHHSREWISVEVPLALLIELTEKYAKDENVKKLVDEHDIWIVPVASPDGLIYSQTKSTMWRKNRRLNADKSYGVDLNRNYGYQWGNVGASNSPGSDTYHGTKAFSEFTSQAIKALAEREKFRTSVSFHSYSELVLYPFGYGYDIPCPDKKLLSELAAEMAKFNGYTPQNSADLYPAMGDSDDWLYGTAGALAFTFELGSQFVPNDAEVDKICADNVKACLHLIGKASSVHASNHPDFSSRTQRAVSTYLYDVNVSQGKDENAKVQLINMLNPANDTNGKNFEEFMAEVAKCDVNAKKQLAPIMIEVKNIYMQNIINKIGNTRQVIRDVEKIQAELQEIE